ncbi:hypothetical protein PILCRDRAFT_467224 [Piloderma croceum F 1598]|uniref:Uncharacterized protein n=1 Tax=Piloderma croceum (strain F 1598) TaxID=765440 RepID=A0A0C3B8G0_PILCF|nr:hypothetical protein PILCRDRAFT_467224 [Piloderma croceum F 1598]
MRDGWSRLGGVAYNQETGGQTISTDMLRVQINGMNESGDSVARLSGKNADVSRRVADKFFPFLFVSSGFLIVHHVVCCSFIATCCPHEPLCSGPFPVRNFETYELESQWPGDWH